MTQTNSSTVKITSSRTKVSYNAANLMKPFQKWKRVDKRQVVEILDTVKQEN